MCGGKKRTKEQPVWAINLREPQFSTTFDESCNRQYTDPPLIGTPYIGAAVVSLQNITYTGLNCFWFMINKTGDV